MHHTSWNKRPLPTAPNACSRGGVPCNHGYHPTLSRPVVASLQSVVHVSAQDDIAALQVRIAISEAERDAWRGAGMQERYLEAYSMVEALELQLDVLRGLVRPRL